MDTNGIKYSDLIIPDNAIEKLIEQLEKLQKVYAETEQKIKSEALEIKTSLEQTTSATEEGRKKTQKLSSQTDELSKAYEKLKKAQAEDAKELARLREALREQNNLNKLTAKLNQSAEGSYNKLSAQYSLNKIKLNQMSEAERQGTEAGKKLERETAKIYEQMKKLQEATGKYTLNVGNYSSALNSLGGVASSVSSKIGAGGLGKAMQSMGGAIGGLGGASAMGAAAGPIGMAVVGITALGGAMADGIGTAMDYEKALSTLRAITGASATDLEELANQARGLGATTRYTATEVVELQTELAKLGYTKDDILNMTDNVLYFAQATGASLAEASSLTGAALRMFEKDTSSTQEFVDKMAAATTKSALSFDYLNNAMSTVSPVANAFGFNIEDVLALLGNLANAGFDASSAATATRNILLNLADANGKLATAIGSPVTNLDELIGGLKKLNDEGIDLATSLELTDKRSVAAFNTFLAGVDSVASLKDELQNCTGVANEMASVMADNLEGDVASLGSAWDDFMIEINDGQGILRTIVQWLIEVVRAIANFYRDCKQTFTELWENSAAFRAYLSMFAVELKVPFMVTIDVLKGVWNELVAVGKVIKGLLTLDWDTMSEGFNDAVKALPNAYKEVADDIVDIATDIVDTVTGANKEIEKQTPPPPKPAPREEEEEEEEKKKPKEKPKLTDKEIKALQKKAAEKAKLEEEARKRELQAKRKAEDLEADMIADQWEKKRVKINLQYSRQIEDLQAYLAKNKNISVSERESINAQITALQEKQTAEIVKVYEEEERAAKQASKKRYDEQLSKFDAEQKLAQSEFDLLETSEREKTEFKLKAERERWKKVLELAKENGTEMSEVERKTIENTIKKIDNEIEGLGKRKITDVYSMFGLDLDDKKKQAINDSFGYAIGQLDNFMSSKVQAAEQSVKSADNEVAAMQSRLDAEIEARNNGLANEADVAKRELEQAKRNQEQALKQQQKAQKQQAALQTLQQAGDLVTASAKIWSELGFPWAIPAIATMWGSFAAAKIKARTATKEQYGEGTVELLQGGSHQSGNDIDLGTKPDGTKRRAEGGEFFAVINKRNSRKYQSIIPSVINSLNSGNFFDFAKKISDSDESKNLIVNTDLKPLEGIAKNIENNQSNRTYTDNEGNVIREFRNIRRVCR